MEGFIQKLKDFLSRQPIVSFGAAVTAFIVAGIGVINSFAPGSFNEQQVTDIALSLGKMWAALAAIWFFVTPTAAPKLPEGKDVILPDGAPGVVTKVEE
jgi:hypothetical protein